MAMPLILSSVSYVTMRTCYLLYSRRSSSCSKCGALFTFSAYALVPHMLYFGRSSDRRSAFFEHLWYVCELSPSLERCSFPCFSLFYFPANNSIELPYVSLHSFDFFLYHSPCLIFSMLFINVVSIVPSEFKEHSKVI